MRTLDTARRTSRSGRRTSAGRFGGTGGKSIAWYDFGWHDRRVVDRAMPWSQMFDRHQRREIHVPTHSIDATAARAMISESTPRVAADPH